MGLKQIVENNKFKVRKLEKIVNKIEALADKYSAMSDEELQSQTSKFKKELANGKTLDDLLVEAFATIREADKRVLGLYPYPVQLLGGIVLHQGNLAEMRTGEGKTLTETMPVYLNALTGKGVHVVTVNEYLSRRDFEEMGPVFTFMGLTVGQNGEEMILEDKKAAYNCDITYSTNDALAFDYLRDNMVKYPEDQVQRGLNYVIVDEVDSILIDEARTPLIISGSDKSYRALYKQADAIAKRMNKNDFTYDAETKTITLERSGILKANEAFGGQDVYDEDSFILAHYLDEAMKANYTMEKDKDYIVKDGEVLIVDTNTGRVMSERRFSDGLHQALEAKEGVEIHDANKTEASVTYQNFFRMYKKLSGMSGTASTESEEFYQTFGMEVVTVPTNKPIARKDLPDVLYPTERAKFRAVLKLIEKIYQTREPVLVGTASVENSELLSKMLDQAGIPHAVLNAKNNKKEAEIIAQAGQAGAVTIATNMAGRGTDIKLGPGVRELGGLYVLGTEKHESRRIDNQLRGRAGRQGDPGKTVFYMSLEDDLIKRFGGERIAKTKDKLVADGEEFIPIKNSRLFNSAVRQSQKKVEGNNFDQRKNTLRYDDVMNEQRIHLYSRRQTILDSKEDLTPHLKAMLNRTVERTVDKYFLDKEHTNYKGLVRYVREYLDVDLDPSQTVNELNTTIRDSRYKENLQRSIDKTNHLGRLNLEQIKSLNRDELKEYLFGETLKDLKDKEEALIDPNQLQDFERTMILNAIDANWKNHIDIMEQLRQSVTLRGYGHYNPLVEYQNMAHEMYNQMTNNIEKDVCRFFLHTEIREGVR